MPGDKFLEIASSEDRRVLDVLFRHAREGVTIQGRDGLVYANDQAAKLLGLSSGQEMLDDRLAEVLAEIEMIDRQGEPVPLESLPGRRVLHGEKTSEVTIGYRLKDSRHVQWSRVGASPIKNDAGEVVWALNFILDITTEVRLQTMEKVLNQVTETLAATLRTSDNLKALADIIAVSLASLCGFRLLDEYGQPSREVVAFPNSPEVQSLFELTDLLPSIFPSETGPEAGPDEYHLGISEAVLQTIAAELGAGWAELVVEFGIDSVLSLPLGGGGRITLARGRDEGAFDDLDLALARDIAVRAGVALTNSLLYERERKTADALRVGLRPFSLPEIDGLDIAVRYQPLARVGHVGGDFYDIVPLDKEESVFLIGDVEGKGVEAAAAVGKARQTLRATVALDRDPGVVINQLNRALVSQTDSRMCTLAYVILKRRGDNFYATVSLAGHPPPLLIKDDGTRDELGTPCPPAGLLDSLRPVPQTYELRRGDTMILYTDGLALPDLPSPETVDLLLPSDGIEDPDALLGELLARFHERVPEARDDIALLAVKVG